jgi:prevent-host-death family protein
MKVIALREARAGLSTYVQLAQQGGLLITKHGRPAAMLIGVEGEEMEDLMTRTDPKFWAMIQQRRRPGRTSFTTQEVRRRLGLRRPRRRRRSPPSRRRSVS